MSLRLFIYAPHSALGAASAENQQTSNKDRLATAEEHHKKKKLVSEETRLTLQYLMPSIVPKQKWRSAHLSKVARSSALHDGIGSRRLEESSNDAQGTLVLFELNLDEDGHSIAVKLGHDFDTKTIDHDFFTDEIDDNLTDGEFNLKYR